MYTNKFSPVPFWDGVYLTQWNLMLSVLDFFSLFWKRLPLFLHFGELVISVLIILYENMLRNTVQNNTIQYNTIQYNTTQHNTTQHNTTQHNTTQHNTTQHNTTQHNTIQYNKTVDLYVIYIQTGNVYN